MGKEAASSELEDKLRPIVEGVVESEGLELVSMRFGRRTLLVTIDREGGVRLSDCATVSHHLSTVLDVEDVIPFSYSLEVSSPGVDRPLRSARDFARTVGKTLRLVVAQSEAAPARVVGKILEATAEEIVVEPVLGGERGRPRRTGEPVRIRLERILEAKQEVSFKR